MDSQIGTSLHILGDFSNNRHANKVSNSHEEYVDKSDSPEAVLVDLNLAFGVFVHCQLDLTILVVVNAIKVAEEHVTKDEELCVADDIGRLDHAEDAASSERWIDVSRVQQVCGWFHL